MPGGVLVPTACAGAPSVCPPGWKYLPTLALPDGSHNYDYDTVYFHLPSLTKPRQTVYGISCFRQIPIDKLKNVTADITRGTVQKSVCVLSRVPYYGHIQVKMALITHAYFEEGDFSKVSLLEDTYHHLNSVLTQNDSPSQAFVGLSARDFILQWKHKAILLFKLLLLEKRIVFYKSPVHPLCTMILTLLSLHPGLIERGLDESASIRLSRPMSPMPNYSDDDVTPEPSPIKSLPKVNPLVTDQVDSDISKTMTTVEPVSDEIGTEVTESQDDMKKSTNNSESLQRNNSTEAFEDTDITNKITSLATIDADRCGVPLPIFRQGYLCLPYLSLSYMDLMSDVNVRGYVVGATNVLFKQKRQLYDVLVDIESCRIECHSGPSTPDGGDLRKQLHLTTEDLRFADYIVRHVSEERHDVFLDGVGFEGGDEWIRTQFKVYLLCLLRTSLLQEGSREIEHFNNAFVSAWRDTYNYKMWQGADLSTSSILEVNPGHPFAGQLSVSDMKLRLSHTMNNTESGRKINQAMVTTGRAVATTSKAVGGAISQAKGAVSSWFSNFLVNPATQKEPSPEPPENEEPADSLEDSAENDLEGATNAAKIIAMKLNSRTALADSKKEKDMVNGLIVEDEKHAEKLLTGNTNNKKKGVVHTV